MSGTSAGGDGRGGGWPLTGRQTIAALLVVVTAVFVFQNTDDATVEFFNVDLTAPLWLVLSVIFVVGAIVGVMLQRRRGTSR